MCKITRAAAPMVLEIYNFVSRLRPFHAGACVPAGTCIKAEASAADRGLLRPIVLDRYSKLIHEASSGDPKSRGLSLVAFP